MSPVRLRGGRVEQGSTSVILPGHQSASSQEGPEGVTWAHGCALEVTLTRTGQILTVVPRLIPGTGGAERGVLDPSSPPL